MNFDIENHRKEFPHTAVQIVEGRLYGVWMIGNNYRRTQDYHGSYPPHYVDRVRSLFPDTTSILHLFSGALPHAPGAITFDINPSIGSDYVGSAEEVDRYFPKTRFSLVMADPPYSPTDAQIYGCKMPNIPRVMRSLHKIVMPGGVVVWLSTSPPMYRKSEWQLVGVVGLHCGTNRKFRNVIFLEKI